MGLFKALLCVIRFCLGLLWAAAAALWGLASQSLTFSSQQYITLRGKHASCHFVAIAGAALLVLFGCAAPAQTPTPSSRLARTPAFGPMPTRAPILSPTPTHTPTLGPTRTVTFSPTVPSTPRPTATPTPTPTPAPVCLGQATTTLRLRAGPSTEYAHRGSLEKGETVGILCRTSDSQWYRISLEDGAIHWVAAAYVNAEAAIKSIPTALPEYLPPTSTPAPTNAFTQTPRPKVNSATANANLRAGPGTSYPVVGGLKKGDTVQIIGKTGDGQWYRIESASGTTAWVTSDYIKVEAESGTIPVVAAADIPPPPSPEPTLPPTATPPPPFRPPTGMLEDRSPGGQGKLLIKNGTDADALVILTGMDDKAVKSAYIRNAESFNMTGIPDGAYRLYYSKGEAFNKETNRFTQNATYQRLDATIEFTTSATQYTAWEVTLYGVASGNVGSEQVDPSRFP
jgi:uncharacterized protein YraI